MKKVGWEVISVKAECPKCGVFEIPIQDVGFHGNESPCGCCGSHGAVDFSANCPKCKTYMSSEVASW